MNKTNMRNKTNIDKKPSKIHKRKNWFARRYSIVILILGFFLALAFSYQTYHSGDKTTHETARYLAESKLTRLNQMLSQYISVADSMATIVVSDGNLEHFDEIAEDYLQKLPAIRCIQMAPNGVVEYLYPIAGNESGVMDLFHSDRKESVEYARDNKVTTVQGPMELKQGGVGLVVRKPIFVDDNFWGFAIVIIDSDKLMDEMAIHELDGLGYEYQVYSKNRYTSETYVAVGKKIKDETVSYTSSIYESDWTLELRPKKGWVTWVRFVAPFISILVITFLVAKVVRQQGHLKRKTLRLTNEALTDSLTDILNRRGGDQYMKGLLKEEPDTRGVMLALDVDNFKVVNDVFGHKAGDAVLKAMVEEMRDTFGTGNVYIRNGGDEFLAFLFGELTPELEERIHEFAFSSHVANFDGKSCKYGISIGYLAYPDEASSYPELCSKADTALYSVKLNGKTEAAHFSEEMREEGRIQLGFNLQDIATGMPGAMMIYKADETQEILFANAGMMKLYECQNWDDFMSFTGGSFKTMVHPDDIDAVQESIRKQIKDYKNFERVDTVSYRIITKKGKEKRVFDIGRLVHSSYYGDLYYVFLHDHALDGKLPEEVIREDNSN